MYIVNPTVSYAPFPLKKKYYSLLGFPLLKYLFKCNSLDVFGFVI